MEILTKIHLRHVLFFIVEWQQLLRLLYVWVIVWEAESSTLNNSIFRPPLCIGEVEENRGRRRQLRRK